MTGIWAMRIRNKLLVAMTVPPVLLVAQIATVGGGGLLAYGERVLASLIPIWTKDPFRAEEKR